MITPGAGIFDCEAFFVTAAYVEALTASYPAIRDIWLIGSRAAGEAQASSDWDYLVFADRAIFEAIATDIRFNDPLVDLLIVYDGESFEKPWRNEDRVKRGTLSDWQWTPLTENDATYRATKARDGEGFYVDCRIVRALRVYPL